MTMWPSRTARVAIASAARTENDSKVISSVGCRDGVEMIEHPQRFEAERLGLLRELDRPRPGVGRIPAVVFALPALGRHQSDLHPRPPIWIRVRRRGRADVHGDASRAVRADAGRLRPRGRTPRPLDRDDRDRRLSSPPARRSHHDDRPADPFDPTAPLAGPPTRGTAAPTPSLRPGPPYHMTDMIAAEPALARRIARRRRARTGRRGRPRGVDPRRAGRPATRSSLTGCGTSEHGALAAAEILREAATAAGPRRAADHPTRAGVRARRSTRRRAASSSASRTRAATRATNAALSRRRGRPARGPRSSPSSRRSPAAGLADIVVETGELDQGWCHTSATSVRSSPPRPSARTCRVDRSTATAVATACVRRRDATTRPAPSAIAGALADADAPARHRLGRGSTGWARARPQGRGGVVAAVRLSRPRDVPARPPAGDGRRPRASSSS